MGNFGMDGKVVLVTGGTSGIGKAASTALAAMGADVVITGRNRERGEKVAEGIRHQTGGKVDLALADLSVQAEVRWLAGEFARRYDRLDVLVNNAGLMQGERTETADGIETTLAVNHLAPFLLTNLLLDTLKKSAPSRVVTVSSEAQRWAKMDLDVPHSGEKYRWFPVYGMTKLANIMFTFELAERLEGTGVAATCMNPGIAVNIRFGTNDTGPVMTFLRLFESFSRTPEQGADTLVWLAAAPEVEGLTGQYFADRKPIGANKVADDPEARRMLWEKSEELTGLQATA